jgi:hypothetical protein
LHSCFLSVFFLYSNITKKLKKNLFFLKKKKKKGERKKEKKREKSLPNQSPTTIREASCGLFSHLFSSNSRHGPSKNLDGKN